MSNLRTSVDHQLPILALVTTSQRRADTGAPTKRNMKSSNEDINSGTTDTIVGNAKIASGTIKEETGKLAHSPKLRSKGAAEKDEGHVQKKIGEIKKVFDL
jgi:uncharacterized protein YjbJ (UPF0337 family)